MLEQSVAAGGDLAELAHVTRLHARIQRGSQAVAEPHGLTRADLFNPRPDRRGIFFRRSRGEFVIIDRRRFDVDIDAIEQRTRNALTKRGVVTDAPKLLWLYRGHRQSAGSWAWLTLVEPAQMQRQCLSVRRVCCLVS
jgi:hypothetical protein